MSFEIISLESLSSNHALKSNYEKIVREKGDVFYCLEYLSVDSLSEDGECHIAIYLSDKGNVIYPFILRPIPSIISQELNGAELFDIITPYEYGGPIIHAKEDQILPLSKVFDICFRNYCKEKNIISETVRFNPILKNHLIWNSFYETIKVRDNIIVNLHQKDEDILMDYHKNKRRDIKVSIKNGVVIKKSKSADDLERFKKIYHETMSNKDASLFYYFNDKYFNELFKLKEKGLVSLYLAEDSMGNIIAGSFFLHFNEIVHYHLSGKNNAYRKLCAPNFLLHSVFLEFKEMGFGVMHLGGASKKQEGLYKFKSDYSSQRAQYYVGKRIHNLELYNDLVGISEKNTSNNNSNNSFFPKYRMN